MSKRLDFNDVVPLGDAVDELVARGRVRATEGTLFRAAATGRLQLFVEVVRGAWGIKVRSERVAHLQHGKAESEDLEGPVSPVQEGIYEFILPAPDIDSQAYLFPIRGPLIRDPKDGSVYQLQQRRKWEASWEEDEEPLRAVSRRGWLDETDPAKYCPADHWPDGCSLGVLRSDLDAFLAAAAPGALNLRATPDVADKAETLPSREPLMQTNRERVLIALRAAGFDPAMLPPVPSGTACPAKSAARAGARLTHSSFDHAWKALLASGEAVRLR
ncbi:MAG: hypothetical protein J0L57_00790 [Burkholderiales bacterium]|nr:hypothetical protein [Burkholderiales bacterium]